MKQLLLLWCILFSSFYTYANEIWECTSTRKNVTIIAPAGYEDTVKTQKIQDAFLKKLVGELDLDELPYKIIILVDPYGFSMGNYRNAAGFGSIAFDTIRPVDIDYLMDNSLRARLLKSKKRHCCIRYF